VASANVVKGGWTVGAGTEWAIGGPWSAKLEYLHIDFGSVSTMATVFPTFNTSSHVTDDIVRVGLNYRFGGPVVAKY
jgi:outer membrane immunogenic protein